jgi:hypothetical protein
MYNCKKEIFRTRLWQSVPRNMCFLQHLDHFDLDLCSPHVFLRPEIIVQMISVEINNAAIFSDVLTMYNLSIYMNL